LYLRKEGDPEYCVGNRPDGIFAEKLPADIAKDLRVTVKFVVRGRTYRGTESIVPHGGQFVVSDIVNSPQGVVRIKVEGKKIKPLTIDAAYTADTCLHLGIQAE
jgi:hypothetical protein